MRLSTLRTGKGKGVQKLRLGRHFSTTVSVLKLAERRSSDRFCMLFGLLCSAFHGREGENKKKKVQKTAFWVGNSHCFSIPGNRSRERQVTHYCVMHAFEHTVCWRGQEGEKNVRKLRFGWGILICFQSRETGPGSAK